MFTNPKRILMAEADAATGAVAPVAAAAATAPEPQAQAAEPTPSVDVDAITAKVSNAVFAALRKSGAFEEKQPKTKDAAPAAAPSTSEERTLLRGLDRTIAQLGFEPTATQYARIERDLLADRPADVASYVKEYFPAPKASPPVQPAVIAAPAAAATTATTAEAPRPAAAPAAPSAHTLPTANGVIDPFSMTIAQHNALGPAGIRGALEQLWKIGNAMNGAPERPKPPQR